MLDIFQTWYAHPDFWKYISMPFIAGIIGWATNWLAVKMTFYPLEPIGWPPFFGWVGILPSKGEKMAGILVDKTISKMGSVNEFFDRMEPEKIAAHVYRAIDDRLEEYVDEVMLERHAVLWENLPNVVKKRVYKQARLQLPETLNDLIVSIGENIDEIVDIKHMVVTQLGADKQLMNRMLWEVGEPEFKFVVTGGFVFGFLFGIIQTVVWVLFPEFWVLPLFGLIVGSSTNWVALNLIFRPINPVKVGPFLIHGLFLKRQKDVARVFARLTAEEMLSLKQIMQEAMTGLYAEKTQAIMKGQVQSLLDKGALKLVSKLVVGAGAHDDLVEVVESKALGFSLAPFDDEDFNRDRGEIIEELFRERMEALSPNEFQDMLRPAFKEDEWLLIAIGGVLGMAAGTGQLILLFGITYLGGG